MHRFDVRESRKILCVECENALYRVDVHGGSDPCIVHLNAGNIVLYKEASPLCMNGWTVRKDVERGLKLQRSLVSFRRS
jgi:hypothetical protein